MRCLICGSLSLKHICNKCQREFLTPRVYKQYVDEMVVISFFKYSEIDFLLKTKNSYVGSYILKILTQNSIKTFINGNSFDKLGDHVGIVPIDDRPSEAGYSHTALISKQIENQTFKPCFNTLRANNDVKYQGQSREFRENNSREFHFNQQKCKYPTMILVDDIITTGSTFRQAKREIYNHYDKFHIFFGVTLAYVE